MFNPLLVFGVNGTDGAGDGIVGRQSSQPIRGGVGLRMTNQWPGYEPIVVSSRHCNNYYSRLSGPITPHYSGARTWPGLRTQTQPRHCLFCLIIKSKFYSKDSYHYEKTTP